MIFALKMQNVRGTLFNKIKQSTTLGFEPTLPPSAFIRLYNKAAQNAIKN